VAVAGPLARLEAEARVVAGEPPDVGELDGSPLLVGDEQHRQLGECLAMGGKGAGDAEREHHAALHVTGAGAVQMIPVAAQRHV
jgi:hypothetical protein